MKTLIENSKAVGSSAYWGERGSWLVVLAIHRDSDALERSNFQVAQQALKEHEACKEWTDDFCPVTVERFNHWAVGWVDYLIVHPACRTLVDMAKQMRARLEEDYPVLDEIHYSQEESNEANEIWQNCYNVRERLTYIRKHRSQFEFRALSDMLGCVRGNYFAGYASELIS